MSIGDVLKTKRAKIITGYIYSWGASIVIIGALFKLQHWQYAGTLLTIGLLTEAIIFFVSAFEPPLDLPDWSRVYPELSEDYAVTDLPEVRKPSRIAGDLDSILESHDLTPDLLKKVSHSLDDLSNTAKGISDISSATLATNAYVRNLNSATEAIGSFGELNTKMNRDMLGSIDRLNRTGEEISEKLNESGSLLARSYKSAAERIEQNAKGLDTESGGYADNLARLNKNLTSLNSSVESQLREADDQFRASNKFNADLHKMNEILAASVNELKRYQENATKLNQHLDALNTIYGNMLGAMNYKK